MSKKYLRRLVWRSEEEIFNPLMHIFFFISLVFGIAFTFYPGFFGADITVLWTLTKIHYGTTLVTSGWGVGLIALTILNTCMLMFRRPWMGGATAGLGFMLWLYAFFTYCLGHFWLGAVATSLPNMLFWVWYYFKVKEYHRIKRL